MPLTGVFQGGRGQDHQQGVLWGRAPGTMRSGVQRAQPRPAAHSRLSQPLGRLGLSPTCRRIPHNWDSTILVTQYCEPARGRASPWGLSGQLYPFPLEVRDVWRRFGCLDSAAGPECSTHMLAQSSTFCGPAVHRGREAGLLSGGWVEGWEEEGCLLNSPHPGPSPRETQSPEYSRCSIRVQERGKEGGRWVGADMF